MRSDDARAKRFDLLIVLGFWGSNWSKQTRARKSSALLCFATCRLNSRAFRGSKQWQNFSHSRRLFSYGSVETNPSNQKCSKQTRHWHRRPGALMRFRMIFPLLWKYSLLVFVKNAGTLWRYPWMARSSSAKPWERRAVCDGNCTTKAWALPPYQSGSMRGGWGGIETLICGDLHSWHGRGCSGTLQKGQRRLLSSSRCKRIVSVDTLLVRGLNWREKIKC